MLDCPSSSGLTNAPQCPARLRAAGASDWMCSKIRGALRSPRRRSHNHLHYFAAIVEEVAAMDMPPSRLNAQLPIEFRTLVEDTVFNNDAGAADVADVFVGVPLNQNQVGLLTHFD
jgi:hypothetical protein